MAKAVVYTIVATVYFLLVLIFYHIIEINDDVRKLEDNINRLKLNRRLIYKITPPHFDPLVSKIQRLEHNHEKLKPNNNRLRTREFRNDDNYFDDNGRLNITLRLMVLFPVLDRNPKDGYIDIKELEAWIVHQTIDGLKYSTQQVFDSHDKNGDGFISFFEYFPQFSNEDLEKHEMEHGKAGWWYEQFKNADADGNGLLSFNELGDFLNPEDSTNEQIHEWLLRYYIRQMDHDNDHKLNQLEFRSGAYNSYKHYVEFEGHHKKVPPADDVFARLDLNHDKLLEVNELKPILQYLRPGEIYQAKQYTRFLISEADTNGDGRLTIDEMIKNDYVFYNTVYFHAKKIDVNELRDEL